MIAGRQGNIPQPPFIQMVTIPPRAQLLFQLPCRRGVVLAWISPPATPPVTLVIVVQEGRQYFFPEMQKHLRRHFSCVLQEEGSC